MCARACWSVVGNDGSAANAASDSSPRVSASPISPWTHDSGPTSKSGVVSTATAEDFMQLYLEACDRAAQLGGELGELADGHVRLLRAFRGFLGDLENALHAARHVGDR